MSPRDLLTVIVAAALAVLGVRVLAALILAAVAWALACARRSR